MAANLIEIFNNTVAETLVKQASGILGESAENTSNAIQLIVPTLLKGLADKANTAAGTTDLSNYMSENNIDGAVLSNATNLLAGGIETERLMYNGAGMLRFLLDDKLSGQVDMIAGSSSLKTSSASSLMKLVLPFLLGIVGKYMQEKNLDATGLKTLLNGQIEYINAGVPTAPKQANGPHPTGPINIPTSQANPTSAQTSPTSRLLPWIILLITSLGLFYFVQKGCGASKPEPQVEAAPPPVNKDTLVTAPPPTPVDQTKSYTLEGGTKIKAIPGSFTANLAEYLTGKETGQQCFVFDQVSFESGSFKLTSGSDFQLKQLSILLNAYPGVKASIEGHTDDAGDNGKNKSLSKERAKVIKTWLTDHSVTDSRIDTKGWGEEKPVASNDTESGRKKNRRVEVCVLKK